MSDLTSYIFLDSGARALIDQVEDHAKRFGARVQSLPGDGGHHHLIGENGAYLARVVRHVDVNGRTFALEIVADGSS